MFTNIFDTHAHYHDRQFDGDRDTLLAELPSAGIFRVVNCGTDTATSKICCGYADRYDYIYAACGVHPHDCGAAEEEWEKPLREMLAHPKCVAVGEIGLDYHYDFSPRETQKRFFERQLQLAKELDLPVIIHDREAHADTWELLQKYAPKGVVHCFSGSVEMARDVVDLGMYIGLGGAVTFKNARKPVEVAKFVPEDRLLLETDCPYMAPVPYRGRRCDSRLIPCAAELIAELRDMDPQTLIDRTTENAKTLFQIH